MATVDDLISKLQLLQHEVAGPSASTSERFNEPNYVSLTASLAQLHETLREVCLPLGRRSPEWATLVLEALDDQKIDDLLDELREAVVTGQQALLQAPLSTLDAGTVYVLQTLRSRNSNPPLTALEKENLFLRQRLASAEILLGRLQQHNDD